MACVVSDTATIVCPSLRAKGLCCGGTRGRLGSVRWWGFPSLEATSRTPTETDTTARPRHREPWTSQACSCPRGEMMACLLLPFLIGAGVYFLSKPGTLFFYHPCGLRATPRTLEGCIDTW